MGQLNSSFSSGGMSLSFNDVQFSSFIQYLKDEGNKSSGLPIKKAAANIGLQRCGQIWVLGKDIQVNVIMILHINYYKSTRLQIDSSGELIDAADSSYFLLDESLAGNVTNVPSSDIYPQIRTPLNTKVTFPAAHLQNYHTLPIYLGSQASTSSFENCA